MYVIMHIPQSMSTDRAFYIEQHSIVFACRVFMCMYVSEWMCQSTRNHGTEQNRKLKTENDNEIKTGGSDKWKMISTLLTHFSLIPIALERHMNIYSKALTNPHPNNKMEITKNATDAHSTHKIYIFFRFFFSHCLFFLLFLLFLLLFGSQRRHHRFFTSCSVCLIFFSLNETIAGDALFDRNTLQFVESLRYDGIAKCVTASSCSFFCAWCPIFVFSSSHFAIDVRLASIYEIDGKQFKQFLSPRSNMVCVFGRFYRKNIYLVLSMVFDAVVGLRKKIVCCFFFERRKSFYRFEWLLSQLGPAIVWIADRDRLLRRQIPLLFCNGA